MRMDNCPRCGGSAITDLSYYDGFSARCSKCKAHLDGYYPSRKAAKRVWNESVAKLRKIMKGETDEQK